MPGKIIKPIYQLLIATLMLCTQAANASNNESINITASYGLDTNPHDLGEEFLGEELEYAIVDISLDTDFKETFFISAGANKSVYLDDARADQFTGFANLSIRHGFDIGERHFEYQLDANYEAIDKTFINKATGLVAQVAGLSAADRYDAVQTGFLSQLSYRPYSYFDLILTFKQNDKAYEELEITTLDPLDYTESQYLLGFEYDASEQGSFFLNGYSSQQEFEDRRGKSLEGIEIDGSLLVFDTVGLNIGYRYQPNEKILWTYTYNYQERRDNVTGYYNSTSGYISIEGRHQFGDYQFITTSLKYSELSLINELLQNIDPFDEDIIASKGGTFNLSYELVIATLFDTKFSFYIDLEHTNFVNVDSIYTFEKSKAFAGLRWSGF